MKKIAFIGSARFSSIDFVEELILNSNLDGAKISQVICRDDDSGFDNAVKYVCARHKIPCLPVKADWQYWQTRCGFSTKNPAGRIRDEKIANFIDIAVVAWNGKSKDVQTFLDIMHDVSKPVYLTQISEDTYFNEYEKGNQKSPTSGKK